VKESGRELSRRVVPHCVEHPSIVKPESFRFMANASAEKIAVVKEVSEKLAKSNAAIITVYR